MQADLLADDAGGVGVDPEFIVVCNNTATSKLVHDYIAGYEIKDADGNVTPMKGKCPLFRNFDPDGSALPRMRTMLVDSLQLESGEAINADFCYAAKDEFARFKDELIQRTGDRAAAEKIDDAAILHEVMNTVGRKGQLSPLFRFPEPPLFQSTNSKDGDSSRLFIRCTKLAASQPSTTR